MASPQIKNGYTPIANEVMEALARADLSGRELRVLLVVMRKTWGWQKKNDRISVGQIAKAIGGHRRHLVPIVRKLADRSFILRGSPVSRTTAPLVSFNKNYEEWDGGIHSFTNTLFTRPRKGTRGSPDSGTKARPVLGTRGSPGNGTDKRKGKKEEIKERRIRPFSKENDGMQPIGELIRKRHDRSRS